MIFIKLDIDQFPKSLYLKYEYNKFSIAINSKTEPKTIVKGPVKAFITYAATQNISLAQSAGLIIDGDLGQLEELKHQFNNRDFDLIELITPYTGDILANEIEKLAFKLKTESRQVTNNLGNMVADYVIYEKNIVVTKNEIENFINQVNKLRDDAEKLEIRFANLQQRIN